MRWVVFLFCFGTFGVSAFKDAFETTRKEFSESTKSEWAAANVWLQSAECARDKGAWLAICEGERLFPIANYALADDPGHAFLLALKARANERSMALVDIARLNVWINLLGMLSVASLLYAARAYVAALIVLALGGAVYTSSVGVFPHASHIGTASLVAILPAAIWLTDRGLLSKRWGVFWIVSGIILLGLAVLLREAIGTMGLIVSVGVLSVVVRRSLCERRFATLFVASLTLLAALISWQMPRWVMLARDVIFKIEPAVGIQRHGFAHNLYIGLGAVPNKFGIEWSDEAGARAVREVDPNVPYVSPDYYRMLSKLYLTKVREDPLEVGRIYAKKIATILRHRLPVWSPRLWIVVAMAAALMWIGRKKTIWRRLDYEQGPILLLVALAFISFFVVQGALAHPEGTYARPIAAFVLLVVAVALEAFVRDVIRPRGLSDA